MENQDNLGNFFRKNLSKSEGASDGWDKPDASVWADAQIDIFAEKTTKKRYRVALFLLAFLLLTGVTGAYIWSLQGQVEELEKSLKVQEIALQKQEEKTLSLEKKAALTLQNQLKEKQEENENQLAIQKEKIALEKTLVIHQNDALDLQKENKHWKQQVLQLSSTLKETKDLLEDKKASILVEKKNTMPVASLEKEIQAIAVNSFSELPTPSFPDAFLAKKEKKNKWKVAYSYSFLDLKMPSTTNTKDVDKAIINIDNTTYLSPTNGLSVAYSPKENWFIRAAYQGANGKTERVWQIVDSYDKSTEYLGQDGEIQNNLSYAFTTPFVAHGGDIEIRVPSETELEEEDILFSKISDYQTFDYSRISLGAEYGTGKRKWNYHLSSGLNWNTLKFKEYFTEAEIKINNQNYEIEKIDLTQKTKLSKSFLGLYAGLGLSYQISPHWSTAATLNYTINLINTKENGFATSDLLAREVGLSVAYHF